MQPPYLVGFHSGCGGGLSELHGVDWRRRLVMSIVLEIVMMNVRVRRWIMVMLLRTHRQRSHVNVCDLSLSPPFSFFLFFVY